MSLTTILLLTAIVLNTILGAFVLLGKTKTASNVYYFVLVIFLSIWMLTNFLVTFVTSQGQAWLLSTIAYVSILGIAYAFAAFCYHFPQKTLVIRSTIGRMILLGLVLVGASVFIPGFMVESIVLSPWKINTGPGVGILFLVFIVIMVCAFTILIKKLGAKTLNQWERSQVRLVLVGTIITSICGGICNLVLPFTLQNYDYVRVGPTFTLIMVVCIAIAIVRYHLFNIKVIATQVFTVVLCVSLFFRTLFTSTLQEQLINIGLLVPTLVVCVFLVRSVLQEVKQREELAAANAGQQSLINIINHQLKGYLAKGRNIFSELLCEPAYGPISANAAPLIMAGFDSLTEGVEFTQQVLNASSVEMGTLEFAMEPFDIKSLIETLAASQEKVAEVKGLTFSLNVAEGSYQINGDQLQIKEAIRNLIDNAIHYTLTGAIELELIRKPTSVVISIADTGVGLTEADREKLFTKGGRGAESLKINTNSTGYGLFFVKGVVDAHHGRTWAKSEGPGKGTTFYVELPVNETNLKARG